MIETLTKQLLSNELQKTLGKSVDAKPNNVAKLTELAVPTLLAGLGKNSSTKAGAASLLEALTQHEGTDVTNLAKALKGVDTTDGAKIIGHILGGNTENVQSNLAKESGLDITQVSGLLNQLAPLLMGALGQQKKSGALDVGNLSKMLLGMVGSGGKGNMLELVLGMMGGAAATSTTKKTTKSSKSSKNDATDLLGSFLKLLK